MIYCRAEGGEYRQQYDWCKSEGADVDKEDAMHTLRPKYQIQRRTYRLPKKAADVVDALNERRARVLLGGGFDPNVRAPDLMCPKYDRLIPGGIGDLGKHLRDECVKRDET